jgi:glutathione-specific gamma-glutamylcyclotransferase
VLGLDRGGACRGIAFRVATGLAEPTIAYLRQREQVTGVYRETRLAARLDDGRSVESLAYVVDREHPQYAGRLERDQLLRLVRHGAGQSGANPDYVRNTHAHLDELGVHDPTLAWLVAHL